MATTRCYLVYALAPRDSGLRQSNRAFNDYVADPERGAIVFHDHFTDSPGGVAIFEVGTEEQAAKLDDPGPLIGWQVEARPLAFSTAEGFMAQVDYTRDRYGGTTGSEPAEPHRP